MSEIMITKTLPQHNRKAKQVSSLQNAPPVVIKRERTRCKTLTMFNVKRFHELFHKNKDEVAQDALIKKSCLAPKPKTSRLVPRRVKKFITYGLMK